MEKAKKAEVVEDLNGVFAKAGSVVVAHYSGMTVARWAISVRACARPGLRSVWPRTVWRCAL